MTLSKTYLAISFALLNTLPAQAANRVYLEKTTPHVESSTEREISFIESFERQHFNSSLQKMQALKLDNDKNLIKYQQTYRGVPVWNSVLVHRLNAAQKQSTLSGFVIQGIEKDLQDVIPNITPKQASTIALAGVKGIIQKVQLFIYQDENQKARLVYLVNYLTQESSLSRPFVIVDAKTGQEIDRWEGLTHAQAIGPGGNEKTGQYYYGQDYPALTVTQAGDTCKLISPNVVTVNLDGNTSGGNVHTFTCPENTEKFINGAYSPMNDAHYFGKIVFDLYKNWVNTSPLNKQLELRVHYGNEYENAFWDGQRMTFGDGKDKFYPLVSLDVVAHEVSHGFTEQNSGLIYRNQSGGINESFSDIAGEAAEYFMKGKNDWLVGADIFKKNGALRYFKDPTKDGNSIGHASDYRWLMNVHHSSGVFNRAFYLLANKPDWNIKKAFKTFVIANQIYWGPSTNFKEGACGVLQAGADLEYSMQDITDAFKTVGVMASCMAKDTVMKISNGEQISGISGEDNERLYYRIDVDQEASALEVSTAAGWFSGDVDLYVHFGELPTEGSFTCQSTSNNSSEKCTIANPKSGSWFVMLKSYRGFSGVNLTAKYY